jgi:hypothetical protein
LRAWNNWLASSENVLFHGPIFTGTFRENGIMYDGMIKAFNRAIGLLGKGERANA